jgi:tight adherence protein B
VRARGQRERLISELERAGMRMRPEEWAILQLATVLAFAAVAFVLFRSAIGVPIGGILGWLACRLFIRIKIDKRAKAFEQQLPDNLQLLAGSLRSGFSLAQALGTVVREGTEPSASEYTRALTEVRLGAELEGALERVADRMRCEDLRWVVMTIRISREVGGNLAEVLDNTVETMRERARLRGQVRVLTAEGRLSARILTALPIFVGTIFVLIRPTYVHPLFHSRTGLIMFAIGVLELCLGAFWLNRLTKIEM